MRTGDSKNHSRPFGYLVRFFSFQQEPEPDTSKGLKPHEHTKYQYLNTAAKQKLVAKFNNRLLSLQNKLNKANFEDADLDSRLTEMTHLYELFSRDNIDKIGIPYDPKFFDLKTDPALSPVFPFWTLFEYNRARYLCEPDSRELKRGAYNFNFLFRHTQLEQHPLYKFCGWEEEALKPVRDYLSQEYERFQKQTTRPDLTKKHLAGLALDYYLRYMKAFVVGSAFEQRRSEFSLDE